MAKFFGAVGYVDTVETSAGVFQEKAVERKYYGDLNKLSRRWEKSDHLNDNLVFNNSLSIVADDYAYNHFSSIRYVKWEGTAWTVNSVEVASPRLVMTFGGVYNGIEEESSEDAGDDSGK